MDMLRRRYTIDMIRYPDIEVDCMLLPQVRADDYAKMAKAFLLYLLGTYLFARGGKMVSLRWLAPFHYFRGAREAN